MLISVIFLKILKFLPISVRFLDIFEILTKISEIFKNFFEIPPVRCLEIIPIPVKEISLKLIQFQEFHRVECLCQVVQNMLMPIFW